MVPVASDCPFDTLKRFALWLFASRKERPIPVGIAFPEDSVYVPALIIMCGKFM